MSFVDKAEILVKAGSGGNGVVAWRHEKFIDRGGPSGGDGGDGGDVVLVATESVNTLASFRHHQKIQADNGQNGAKQNKHGRNGEDVVIEVPVGTVITRDEEEIADLSEESQQVVVAYGGKGGFGNAHFKSSRRRSPKVAEKGEPGDEYDVVLELKLLADVGLIGLPNAGKSTLLSVISNARPEIANYPFTTLQPNLGVVDAGDKSVLFADIPGLISGASEGKGLGDDFLRHVERTAVLVHLIDVYSNDVVNDYATIMNELRNYKVDLSEKPQIIALSKTDGMDQDIIDDQKAQLKPSVGSTPILAISSHSKDGLSELIKKCSTYVEKYRKQEEKAKEDEDDTVVYTIPMDERWEVSKKSNSWIVSGKKIEKFARRTDFENEYGVIRLKDIMRKMGITHELEKRGINKGDRIKIGKSVFEY